MVAVGGAVPGLLGVAHATQYRLLLVAAFELGFFLLGAVPIGFQYGAEIPRPTPEGTPNGLLLLIGQVSGVAFIVAMDAFKDPLTGSMTMSLLGLTGVLVLCAIAATQLRESPLLTTQRRISTTTPSSAQA